MTYASASANSARGLRQSAGRLLIGQPAPRVTTVSLDGSELRVPRSGLGGPPRWTLVSFLRYASCPMCNLRMRELNQLLPTLEHEEIDLVIALHSPEGRARQFVPSALAPNAVADPTRVLYRRYGVSPSWLRTLWSVVLPSFYLAWGRAVLYGYWGGWIDGSFATMPADFLVTPEGRLAAVHYGRHIGDHLGIADLLAAKSGTAAGV